MAEYLSSLINFSHSVTTRASDGYALHCHPMFEIYYFICGDVDYLVEGVPYYPARQSLLLLSPGTFHGFRCNSPSRYERYTLHFDRQALAGPLQETLLAPFFSSAIYIHDARACRPYLDGIESCRRLPAQAADACVHAHLLALLGHLCLNSSAAPSQPLPERMPSLTQQVISYLQLNLGQPHTLESLSRRFFVSRSQLSRAFAQETGASVAEYIRRKRLIYVDQLRRQGMSATEAALKAGFGDYSTYYRTLKKARQKK